MILELYEVSTVEIEAGVYNVDAFNINLTYIINDNYDSPFYIGGERYISLRYDPVNNELYAKKEGVIEETLLRDSRGEWVQSYYSKFFYYQRKTVSATWAAVLNDSSFTKKYNQIQNGIPANVNLILDVEFNQTGSEVSISYTIHDWWEKTITKTYRNDFQVLGYTETKGSI